jgi:hypothetical protein
MKFFCCLVVLCQIEIRYKGILGVSWSLPQLIWSIHWCKNDYIQLRHDLAFMFGKEKEITEQISRFDSAIATHMLHSKVK